MSPVCAIDTSILVRLVTGLPSDLFNATFEALQKKSRQGVRLIATSMVIGEAYVAMQHHYELSKADARQGLIDVLEGGLIAPSHGAETIATIKAAARGCGLMDRLIALDARLTNAEILTLDKKMSSLAGAQLLKL